MPKVKRIVRKDEGSATGDIETGQYGFVCPGCGQYHAIPTRKMDYNHPVWKFNGDVNFPTFEPSVNVKWGKHADKDWQEPEEPGNWSGICHFIITNGFIHFCNDCTHSKVGQVVEMPEVNPQLI